MSGVALAKNNVRYKAADKFKPPALRGLVDRGRYELLPTVSFVMPNLKHDMHNGDDPDRIKQGDAWLKDHLNGYVQWAKSHNSLLIVTFDEGYCPETDERDCTDSNHIFTLFVGEMVKHGRYDQKIDHCIVLRTIEEMYGLAFAGNSAASPAISNIWKTSTNH